MPNPWNGKAVLEVFWWNCSNTSYSSWYTYLAKLAPTIAKLGFDGIWTPPPCKGNGIAQNMGYEPYDYYDLGQKNQQGGVATWFGSQDDFLRMVAVCHANGLEVYPDIVLDHCGPADPDPDSLSRTHNITTPVFTALALRVLEAAAGPATGSTSTTTRSTGMAGATGRPPLIQRKTTARTSAIRADAATPAQPRPIALPAPMRAHGSSGSSNRPA